MPDDATLRRGMPTGNHPMTDDDIHRMRHDAVHSLQCDDRNNMLPSTDHCRRHLIDVLARIDETVRRKAGILATKIDLMARRAADEAGAEPYGSEKFWQKMAAFRAYEAAARACRDHES